MKLTQLCPICGKRLELVSSHILSSVSSDKKLRLNSYKCGHLFTEEITDTDISNLEFVSVDGSNKIAREYQKEGVKFILDSDFNAIIGDQMRLGKTPQSLLALRNKYSERTPCLIIVRAANLWQWIREYKTWVTTIPNGIFPILGTKGLIPPGFDTYIISMDTFSRVSSCKNCGHSLSSHHDASGQCRGNGKKCKCIHPLDAHDSIVDRLSDIDFKLIIADEAHSFKNTDSNRSQALVNFLKEKNTVDAKRTLFFKCHYCQKEWEKEQEYKIVNGQEQATIDSGVEYCECGAAIRSAKQKEVSARRKCGVILLTGTAIKNRADEYYVPLNLVAPTQFPSLERFRRNWLMQDSKGQWSRVSPYAYEKFKTAIAPYVLRREKEDVYKDLPALNRMFTVIEPEKGPLTEQYNKLLDKMDAKFAEKINPTYWDMQDDLMQLRRICGLMKVMWTADYAEACLMDSESLRLAIGIHHYDVSDVLRYKLAQVGCLKLDGRDNPERKDWIMTHFQATPERICVFNMIAGGVGLDLPYVSKVIILERAWSFADEEQFEFRFYNPDKDLLEKRGISRDKITEVEYIIAKGTIDSIFYDMIEYKKVVQGQTIGTNWDVKTTPGLFKELLQETLSHRL
jgi:SNF2 family DNA or RNA helicase